MEAIVMNYRHGRHHVNQHQMVLKVGSSLGDAKTVVGKTVQWTSPAGKVLVGKISAPHGRNGNVRAIFADAGLPGQALGQKVKIE